MQLQQVYAAYRSVPLLVRYLLFLFIHSPRWQTTRQSHIYFIDYHTIALVGAREIERPRGAKEEVKFGSSRLRATPEAVAPVQVQGHVLLVRGLP